MKALSSYKIHWVEFSPVNGKFITKHDRKAFGDIMCLGNRSRKFRRPFPSKADAVTFLTTFGKKLDHQYECRLFTDKQFGMAQAPDYDIKFTKKQIAETYLLG